MIELRMVTRENWRETLQLSVAPEQQQFVAAHAPIALVGLSKAFVRPMGWLWTPFAIYADALMIGFLMLADELDSTDHLWLFHFFIDQHYQGRGYGKSAMRVLMDWIQTHHPACHSIRLTVHAENIRAQRFYRSLGFEATGEQAFDEPVYRLGF